MRRFLYSIYKPIFFIKLLFIKPKRPDNNTYSKKYYIELANEIISGRYDNGYKRIQNLKQTGYKIDEINYAQEIVNKSMGTKIKGIKYILIYLFS